MTRAEARTAIQASFETVAGAPTTAELNVWIDLEHKNFRRELADAVPSLYESTTAEQTLTTADDVFELPADFETLVRFERKYGTTWQPVEVADGLMPQLGDLSFLETGATLKVGPNVLAPGTYRAVYIAQPATLSAESGTGGVLLVPAGCEDVILERVAARCRIKLEEDPSPHTGRAAAVWREQKRALRKRYGRHPVPGLRVVRGW